MSSRTNPSPLLSRVGHALGFGALLAVAGCRSLPGDVAAVLENADKVEVFALDPLPAPDEPRLAPAFHGYRIIGKAEVKDAAERARIVALVEQGVRASDGTVAACF